MDSTVLANIVLALHLIPIAWIDFQRLIIPNILNLSLAICGLAVSVAMLDKTLVNVLLAGGLTLAIFLLISMIYGGLRNRRGIGAGDVKFLGAAATWIGLIGIPWIILIASISGLLFAVVAGICGRATRIDSRLAFGPHLSLGLLVTWQLKDLIVVHG